MRVRASSSRLQTEQRGRPPTSPFPEPRAQSLMDSSLLPSVLASRRMTGTLSDRAARDRSAVRTARPSFSASATRAESPPSLKYAVSKPKALSLRAVDPSIASATNFVCFRRLRDKAPPRLSGRVSRLDRLVQPRRGRRPFEVLPYRSHYGVDRVAHPPLQVCGVERPRREGPLQLLV